MKKMFNPGSIAVIGASSNRLSVGYGLFRNIIDSKYKGLVYAVNNKRKKVQGINAYESVVSLPGKIDLAIIITPAKTVPDIVNDCALKKIENIIIISAGFSESGAGGQILSNKIAKIIQENNIKIIGPNCLGFLNPSINLNASFAAQDAKDGDIAFISQSGAFCTAMLDWSIKNSIGFSNFISIGSMIDIGFYELLKYLKDDKKTKSIVIYMESLTSAGKFLRIAKDVSVNKPIFILKAGSSTAGASAAKSHTGSLTGDDLVFSAAFERAGIVRLETLSDLFGVVKFLSVQNSVKGNRLAIITNAGGPGVISTDFLMKKSGVLAKISKKTIKNLNKVLPNSWSHSNPIDILGDADADSYKNVLEVCLGDKNIDSVFIILTPQSMTNPSKVAKELVKIFKLKGEGKTVFASFIGGNGVEDGLNVLRKNKIPSFTVPERAINAFIFLNKYNYLRKNLKSLNLDSKNNFRKKIERNRQILNIVKNEKRNVLMENESKSFLNNYGIRSSKNYLATTKKEAEEFSLKIGFPVVMKILSPDIIHKTDVGGVVLDIENKKDAGLAFERIIDSVKKNNKQAKIKGIFIEKVVKKKFELIIGCKKDDIFGHVVIFGKGGISVGIWKDTAVELLPLNPISIEKMFAGTKIFQLLKGYRGLSGVDVEELKNILLRFSELLLDFPEIKELDINPYSIDEEGGVVLDAKVLLG